MIANRTTTISAEKTVSEIQTMLANAKATAMMIDYSNGQPDGISFRIMIRDFPVCFRLPANWQGILSALKKEKQIPRRLLCEEHARRVCWRVLRDWLRAQLSLVEAGAANIEEIMLPWAITPDGSTFSEKILSSPQLLIETKGIQ